MRVGVTGGAGFIGGYVVEELHSRGHGALVLDHMGQGTIDADIMLGDVRDSVAMMELAANTDAIIHLAACLGTQETIKNPAPAVETNINGGLNFLEACAHYNIPGVYIGVGNHWFNTNPYSITKTTIEKFVVMFNKHRGTQVNVVRAMNAYGPRQQPAQPFGTSRVRKITPAFICRALAGMPVEVYGTGEQVSDMVYVADVARALVSALEAAANNDVFDRAVEVGPYDHITVQEFARMVIAYCGSSSEVVNLPMRPGEIPDSTVSADCSTLALVGMDPADLVPLNVGLKRTVEYFQLTTF